VAAGGSGQTYVADFSNQRIQEFDATGRFVRQWGRLGSGDGQFNGPVGVAVGGNGHVYVTDPGNDRIVRVKPL
jgi:DNA-binding beta-propeller fold protein YncE